MLWPEEQARELMSTGAVDAEPVLDATHMGRFNRFVLEPTEVELEALAEELPPPYSELAKLVGFAAGLTPTPPEPFGDGEIRGLIALLRANGPEAELELKEGLEACRHISPLLGTQILAQLAELEGGPLKIQHYKEALSLCPERSLQAAEIWLSMGIAYQQMARPGQRGALVEAVACYQRSLQYFKREEHPESYALAQNNMALAYLSMPMTEAGDQLKMGIAVQALREVLKVYTKENAPQAWASAQMNLANSLQYLPSAHPEQNLAEAVEIYEQLLPLRDREADPLGYARLVANQGNALAHLGVFRHAREKFQEARECFLRGGDDDSAAAVEEQLQALPSEKEPSVGAL